MILYIIWVQIEKKKTAKMWIFQLLISFLAKLDFLILFLYLFIYNFLKKNICLIQLIPSFQWPF